MKAEMKSVCRVVALMVIGTLLALVGASETLAGARQPARSGLVQGATPSGWTCKLKITSRPNTEESWSAGQGGETCHKTAPNGGALPDAATAERCCEEGRSDRDCYSCVRELRAASATYACRCGGKCTHPVYSGFDWDVDISPAKQALSRQIAEDLCLQDARALCAPAGHSLSGSFSRCTGP